MKKLLFLSCVVAVGYYVVKRKVSHAASEAWHTVADPVKDFLTQEQDESSKKEKEEASQED